MSRDYMKRRTSFKHIYNTPISSDKLNRLRETAMNDHSTLHGRLITHLFQTLTVCPQSKKQCCIWT